MSGIGHDRYRAQQRAAARFPARYPGKCPTCGERIHVDDDCRWEGDDVVHADCGAIPDPLAPTTDVCPTCHQTRAVNGTCGGCDPE